MPPNGCESAGRRRFAAKVVTERRPSACDFSSAVATGKIEAALGLVPIQNNPPRQGFLTAPALARRVQAGWGKLLQFD